jgi:Tfp pilus assembly protein PilO
MKPKLTYLLWFGLPIVLIIVWIVAFYMPFSLKIKLRENELKNVRQQVDDVNNQTKIMVEAKKKSEQDKFSVGEIKKNIPVFDEFPDFVRGLVKTAKSHGVLVNSLNGKLTSPEGPQGLLVSPVFEIGLTGAFLDIGKFLDDLERKAAYKRITKAHIAYGEKDYPALNAAFTVDFKAWRGGIFENK